MAAHLFINVERAIQIRLSGCINTANLAFMAILALALR
jgi:hypothetical protein